MEKDENDFLEDILKEQARFLRVWRSEEEVEDKGISLEALEEDGYTIEEKEEIETKIFYRRRELAKRYPPKIGLLFSEEALDHIFRALKAIQKIDKFTEGDEQKIILELIDAAKAKGVNYDISYKAPKVKTYFGFDKELAKKYFKGFKVGIPTWSMERSFRALLRLGRVERGKPTLKDIETILWVTKTVETVIKYYKILWLRTQFARLYYAQLEKPDTPYPLCEFRVFVYHQKSFEYSLQKFEKIEWHLGLMQSRKRRRNHKDWLKKMEQIIVVAEEESEPVGDKDVQPEAIEYVHRHAIWYKKRTPYQKRRLEIEKEYSERDFTPLELELLNANRLKAKLHHVRGVLITREVKRDYDIKYV